MSQNMTFSILTDKIAQVSPKAHVSHGRLVIAPSLNRKTFEENEPFAVEQLGSNGGQAGGELREMEILLLGCQPQSQVWTGGKIVL